ncbi:Fc.00g068200.m01.CDS01 [Cosmosporella sp. VM-42]
MFASAGRAVARRFPSATTQLFAQPLVIRPALATRSFTVAQRVLLPAKAASGAKKSTKTTTASKKKKTAAKPKAAKKPKAVKKLKELTPEQVARAERSKERKEILKARVQRRAANELALLKQEPKALPQQAWPIYITEQYKKQGDVPNLPEFTKELAASYKNLSSSELETLKATAEENKATNEANYKAWVHTHPPEAIWLANKVRRRIQRDTGKTVRTINDERLPKPLLSPYNRFIQDRCGDRRGNSTATDHFRTVTAQWKTLSEEEKRPYYEEYEQDKKQLGDQAERLLEKVKELEKGIRETAREAAKAAKVAK